MSVLFIACQSHDSGGRLAFWTFFNLKVGGDICGLPCMWKYTVVTSISKESRKCQLASALSLPVTVLEDPGGCGKQQSLCMSPT